MPEFIAENEFDYQGLVLFGASGNVGTRLIEKVTEEDYPKGEHFENPNLEQNPVPHQHPSKIMAVADSKRYFVDVKGISAEVLRGEGDTKAAVKKLLAEKGTEYKSPKEVVTEVKRQVDQLVEKNAPKVGNEHVVYVDMTDGDGLKEVYDEVLHESKSGMVAVNKGVLASLSKKEFDKYIEEGRLEFRSTVGAGADAVDNCLKCAESAHPITEITATLSGTCGKMANALNSQEYRDGEIEFDEIASSLYPEDTEPHPHTDFSGEDVKKKIIIMALASGYDVSMDDIVVENPIVPDSYGERFPEKKDVPAYLKALKEHNGEMRKLVEATHKEGKVLLYVARMKVDAKTKKAKVTVGLEAVDPIGDTDDARIARAKDNMIILRNDIQTRISEKPGSGRDVTAAAIQDGIKDFVPKGMKRVKDSE